MRKLLPGLSAGLTLAWALSGAAQNFRAVTWQSDDFPAPANGAPTDDPDVKRLRQMAGVLKPYNADLILLEGLADRQACQRLLGMLKPANYTIATYHVFRGGVSNQPVAPSIAILTRKAPLSARAVEWRTSGQIDTPGGFNFVSLPFGSNVLCFYASRFVDAPAATTNARVAQANSRKREFAAQYLLHHTRWLESSLTNPLSAFVLAGNLSTGPTSGENALKLLEDGAFKRAAPLAAGEAGLMAAKDWLARNAEFNGAPQLGLPKSFSYGPVLCELSFKPPSPPPLAVAAIPAGTKAGSWSGAADSIFRKFPVDERVIWLAVPVLGAALLLLIILLPYRWLQARRQAHALVLRRRSRNAVVVDFAPPAEALGQTPTGALPGESATAGWEERAREAEQRASKAAAVVREGLMPQLVRLMREKIFQRLSSQRAQLLDSHLNGTMAVLELEERLEKIQSQFATRLAAREQRIAELEAELSAKENIIRELIKAQARLAGRVSNE